MEEQPPLMIEILPAFAEELRGHLIKNGRNELPGQLSELRVVEMMMPSEYLDESNLALSNIEEKQAVVHLKVDIVKINCIFS